LVLIRQYGGYDGYRGGFYYAAEARAQAELVQYAGLLVVAICGIYALYRYISGDRYDEDIQRLVCRTLKPLPVIAVGDKVTGYGAAKIITTDADWEGVARRLMNDAKVIIFCPFPTPGATIELGILSRDYLDKTVFVMPPRNRRLKIDVGAEWNKLAKSQAPKIVLPAYSRYGGVFLMNSAGGAGENRCDFNSLFSLRNLKEAVKIVVSKRSLGADQQINIASAGGTV
jgi:hypothetical protein